MSLLKADTIKPVTSGGDLSLQGDSGGSAVDCLNITSAGDINFTGNTDAKIKLPSAGGIYESDGSTAVLTESGGAVTLDNVTLGSSAVFPAGAIQKYEPVTTVPVATQGTDLSYVDLTGSSISYTPATGASYVVYEYTTTFQNDTSDTNSQTLFWFNYDGSTVANTNHNIAMQGNAYFAIGYKSFKFILPAWSGAKTMSLSYRAYSSSNSSQIHKSLESGDPTGGPAFTKIYQSTYSVM
jgi:hypothetical protein